MNQALVANPAFLLSLTYTSFTAGVAMPQDWGLDARSEKGFGTNSQMARHEIGDTKRHLPLDFCVKYETLFAWMHSPFHTSCMRSISYDAVYGAPEPSPRAGDVNY